MSHGAPWIPPGWYADPLRRYLLRYWDGGAWTHFGWRSSVEVDPLGLAPSPSAARRFGAALRRNRLVLALTALAAVLIVVTTLLAGSPAERGNELLTWLLVGPVLLANAADRWRWLRWVAAAFGALACLLTLSDAALSGAGKSGYDWLVWLLAAAGMAAVLAPPVRRRLAKVLPIDPTLATHALALLLAIAWLAFWAWSQASSTALDTSNYSSGNAFDGPLGELPFAGVAVVGVGFLVRRDWKAVLRRLALVKPGIGQVVAALLVAETMTWVAVGADWLMRVLTPATAKQLDEVGQVLYGGYGDAALPWVLLAAGAGVCEEVLFRGALQPRLGLPLTALLFASTHIQYGLSIVLGTIVLAGFVLGLLRRYTNTTTTIACHFTYDLLAGLTFPLSWFAIACALQAPLLAYFVWRRRRLLADWLRTRPRGVVPGWAPG